MSRVSARRTTVRIQDGVAHERNDVLAGEEPLEIRLNGAPLTVTMRTPGDDFDLALGFLVGEGVIRNRDDVVTVRYCAGADGEDGNTYNVVDVRLAPTCRFHRTHSSATST